jgi:glucosylceramidase
VIIDADSVVRNPAYYIIAHASKFVEPNSLRIDSNLLEGLPNVAFLRPDGKKVLIVLNESDAAKTFTIKEKENGFTGTLNPGAVGTWVW